MGYRKWSKNTINEQIKIAYKMFNDNPTRELAFTINTLEDLKNNKPNIFNAEEKFEEQIAYDKSILSEQVQFLPEIDKFSKLNDIYKENIIKELTIQDIPNRLLLSYVHDFYNSLDREFAKYFNRIFKERKRNLRLTTNNHLGYNRNYMTYLNTFNYAYINISLTSTIDDFINVIHEYAHTIADQMCYRPKYGKYPFIELLPLFVQEIAYDRLIDDFENIENDVIMSNALTTKTILKYAKELILQQEYLSIINKSLERKQFVNNLAEYSNNTKSKTEKMLNITIQEKISYVIPYITMIELYDMYYKDKEKSLAIIKDIITMDEENDYIEYLNNMEINLNEHSKEFVDNQKKKLKLTHNV